MGIGEVHRAVAARHARRAPVRVPPGLQIRHAQQHALRHVVLGGRRGERLLQPVLGGPGVGRGRPEQWQQQSRPGEGAGGSAKASVAGCGRGVGGRSSQCSLLGRTSVAGRAGPSGGSVVPAGRRSVNHAQRQEISMSTRACRTFPAAVCGPAGRQWLTPMALRAGFPGRSATRVRTYEGPRYAAVLGARGPSSRQRVPTAARTARRASWQSSCSRLSSSRCSSPDGAAPGWAAPGAAGVVSCIERCTAVS